MNPSQPRRANRPIPQRSLLSNGLAALFRPQRFFTELPASPRAQQHALWLALLLILLSVWLALRPASADPGAAPGPGPDMPSAEGGEPTFMVNPGGKGLPAVPVLSPSGPIMGEVPFDPTQGEMPMSDSLVEPAASVDVAQSWFIGLQAILGTGLIWVAQAIFLCEVPLLRGRAPNLGLNLRVAVWVNLPLALLVIVQTLFVSSGGQLGQPGLSGLLVNHPAYLEWPLILRELAMTLSSQMTLFWLWSMALLYMGARRALHGSRWMALLVVLLWTLALSIVPTALRLLQGAS